MTKLKYLHFDHFSFNHSPNYTLFKDFSLTIPTQHWLGILGPSGVGKSTLLHAIARYFQTQLRISILPQKNSLFPWMSVLENVLVGDKLRHQPPNIDKALALLKKMGLANFANQMPNKLSGGQSQRVTIARTLYEESDLILMDEPFCSLDAITKQEAQDCAQQHFSNKTVVLVTHDPFEALRLCHQIIVLKGTPAHYKNPLLLHSSTPRKLEDQEVLQNYEALMSELHHAKQSEKDAG